jgi:hypothetical protein
MVMAVGRFERSDLFHLFIRIFKALYSSLPICHSCFITSKTFGKCGAGLTRNLRSHFDFRAGALAVIGLPRSAGFQQDAIPSLAL